MIHELGHYLAMRLCGVSAIHLNAGSSGTYIVADTITVVKELIISISGPLLGMIPIIFASHVPKLAICALIHTIYNIIPIYPNDGGRVLQNLLAILFHHKIAQKVFTVVETVTVIFINSMFFYLALKLHLSVVLPIWVIFLFRYAYIKYPCKRMHKRVQ